MSRERQQAARGRTRNRTATATPRSIQSREVSKPLITPPPRASKRHDQQPLDLIDHVVHLALEIVKPVRMPVPRAVTKTARNP